MFSLSRVLGVVVLVALAGGPISMAPAFAQETLVAQVPATATRITGVVADAQGATVRDVTVTLTGAKSYATKTDARGAFAIDVAPGIYSVSAHKAGFSTATEADFVVAPGTPAQTLNVTMQQQTFSSLQVIGRTSTNVRRSTFNAGPAAVQTLSSVKIEDQAQPQIINLINELPGAVTESPNSGGNNSAPGAIRFVSIRGAFGNETASLIDGHPLANGSFGDFVASWLNSSILGGIELVKGPGAAAPQVINGIGGTVNFRTREPLRTPGGSFTQGFDVGQGGAFTNLLYSGTHGKFGWVLDYAVNGATSALHDSPGLVSIPTSALINGASIRTTGGSGASAGYQLTSAGPQPGVYGNGINNQIALFGCCQTFNANYNNRTALVKGKYQFSATTSLTASFISAESYADQNGNHLTLNPATFKPASNYTGTTYAAGTPVGYYQYGANSVIPPNFEWDHEPMFNLEFRTGIKDMTVLARAFSAGISRLQMNPNGNSAATLTTPMQLYGTAVTCTGTGAAQVCAPQSFNGGTYTISMPPGNAKCSVAGSPIGSTTGCTAASPNFIGYNSPTYFSNSEQDNVRGYSLELDKPIGKGGNLLSVAYDYSRNESKTYNYGYGYPDISQVSIPAGSYQTFGTLLVRGIFDVTPKLNATLSNYFTTFTQNTSQDFGQTFVKSTSSRYDPRLGLVFRPNVNTSARFALGGSVSFPYLGIGDRANGPVPTTYTQVSSTDPAQNYATRTLANPQIKPETAFGYDLGADFRVGRDRQTVISGDVYRTNLFNQFLTTNILINPYPGPYTLCTGGATLQADGTCRTSGGLVSTPQTPQVFGNQTINLGDARYEGIELAISRDPVIGFGFTLNTTLQRAYDYNISRCIYYSSPLCNGPQNANLGVIPNVNFPEGGAFTSASNYSTVQNHSIPYSTGYGEIRYRGVKGTLVQFSEQYLGPNNSLALPAFFIAAGSIRVPVGDAKTSVQLSVYNMFNVYPNAYITSGAGVPVNLVNGQIGLTNQNSVGPRNVRLVFTRKFGGL